MMFLTYMKHDMATYELFFGSLSNPNRLQIINLLRAGPKNVNEICLALGFEQTMVSHNLKRLEKCGMVMVEVQGKFRFYTLNMKTITPLMELIDAHMSMYCSHVVHPDGKMCH